MLGCKTAIPLSRKLRTRSPIERGGRRPLSLPLDSKPMMERRDPQGTIARVRKLRPAQHMRRQLRHNKDQLLFPLACPYLTASYRHPQGGHQAAGKANALHVQGLSLRGELRDYDFILGIYEKVLAVNTQAEK